MLLAVACVTCFGALATEPAGAAQPPVGLGTAGKPSPTSRPPTSTPPAAPRMRPGRCDCGSSSARARSPEPPSWAPSAGLQGGEIAAALVVSPETVKSHVQHAMTKLGAHTRAHAVAIALSTGQIEMPHDLDPEAA